MTNGSLKNRQTDGVTVRGAADFSTARKDGRICRIMPSECRETGWNSVLSKTVLPEKHYSVERLKQT